MKIIESLILKDVFEYRNNFIKVIGTFLIAFAFPIIVFNFSANTSLFSNISTLVDVILILSSSLIYCETTLFQIHRNIRDGVYEKLFINRHIEKYQIFLSKFISNLFISFVIFGLVCITNEFLGIIVQDQIKIVLSFRLIMMLILSCGISTALAFMNSLVINDEKNAITYGGSLVLVYIGYYKILEILKITNVVIEIVGLAFILVLSILFVSYLLKQRKFISRY